MNIVQRMLEHDVSIRCCFLYYKNKGKALPLQAWAGLEGG
jgi:hypothetical protein